MDRVAAPANFPRPLRDDDVGAETDFFEDLDAGDVLWTQEIRPTE